MQYLKKEGLDPIKVLDSSPEYYIKIFSDADSILRFASKEQIEKAGGGKKIDEIAKMVYDGNPELARVEEILANSQKISAESAFQKISSRFLKYPATAAITWWAFKEDSMNEKYMPIGVNAIGMKSPYVGAFYSGDGEIPPLNNEVQKYYIQLQRDYYGDNVAAQILHNQAAQRFFLASPCKTDLKIIKTKCECLMPEPAEDYTFHDFGSGASIPVEKDSIEGDYNKAIKACADPSVRITPVTKSETYVVDCILVDPLITETSNNFCYGGSHIYTTPLKWAVWGGTVTASIGTDVLIAGLAPETGGLSLFARPIVNTAIDAVGAGMETYLSKTSKWPNH
jgi:hypothetical protein